ncbi:aprataxin and PNK-like factor [Toxotes jaculatrix]|uniref:aprataxin and PNK-like factor n=1 Tax=Toxotes jaculatrix TaxID=941984 RepID=UPI001B3B1224|nr:aprataxin and PNK-like factor [Toxotes jaculatrix]
MSGFDLVPVDGGTPVHLPPGETVLGRGPFLGVTDKRVSRHHGLLENLDGQLRLKPTHLNPCFVQSSLTDDPRPLQKDSWHPLHHGDIFSLLPGQFIYKVVAVGGGECTPRNSQVFKEEEEELPGPPEPDVEPALPIRQGRAGTPPPEDEDGRALNEVDSALPKTAEDDHGDAALSAVKKRVLPAWMMAAAAAPHAASSSPKGVKRRKTPAGAAAKQATPTATSLPKEAELSEEEEEERPRKRRNMSDDEENEPDNFHMEAEEQGKGREMSMMDRDATTPISNTSESEKDKEPRNRRQTTKRAESEGSNGGSAAAPSKPGRRTPCPYGKDCYRKNPFHFQECSHPGDTDYEEEEEEEADRPECPYGTDCYRKNPLHRKEYKHTKRPARAARTVPKPSPDDEEEGDSGDDDSFIDDNSEDVGDDSDYVPPDSDDSGKEDIKRLQREAQVFLKRRK